MKTATFLAAIAFVIGHLHAFPGGYTEDCPKICPLIYQPVCAYDGEKTQIFASICQMLRKNCAESLNFQPTKKVLPWDACSLDSDTDSGSNDIVDSLDVEDSNSKVPDVQGEAKDPDDCRPCPRTYLPVCASDGEEVKTFANDCMVEFINCIESRSFEMMRSGECEEDSK